MLQQSNFKRLRRNSDNFETTKKRKVFNESSQEEDFIDDSEQVVFSQYSQQSDDEEDQEVASSDDEYDIQEGEEEEEEQIEEAEIPNRIINVNAEEDEYHFSQESETPPTETAQRVRASGSSGEGTLDVNLQKGSCERYVRAILGNFVAQCCDQELEEKINREIDDQQYPIQYFINTFKNHFWIEDDFEKSENAINCQCCNHSPVRNLFIVKSKGDYTDPIYVGCKCALLFYLDGSDNRQETKRMVEEKLYNVNRFFQ
ncbi:predicted protein [Naegleria gruberi]|uniref:Predicted protein n=1 Tax=Naegleria gruberi TaxID=5762 RepID=D2UZ19_NAEGR|nr:uncharacterized protein NAEGRDRAFT_61781 [Naegleria gruberi]EFC49870.1 predicted protein [Naegleria gruberi]|eukprot:XP_002682614.1 predicted protein [Naegleria gruberi strain NEG-M]